MDEILEDIKWKEKWDDLNRKFLILFDKDPSGIVWKNINNEKVEFWLRFALENEFYNVAKLFHDEKIKRNMFL